MGRLETTGLDDQDHLAVIGALSSIIKAPVLQRAPMTAPAWMQNATPQGVSTPAEELDFLPLEGVDFTNSGGAAADLESKLQALPQRPFRGERIIMSATLIGAGGGVGDALFRVIITPAIYVGAVQVGATQGSMPAAAFGATAFGVRLSFPVAGQGTRIYLPIFVAAIGAGDRIIINGGIFGRAVR